MSGVQNPPPETDRMVCPTCGSPYAFSAEVVGREFACTNCGSRFRAGAQRATVFVAAGPRAGDTQVARRPSQAERAAEIKRKTELHVRSVSKNLSSLASRVLDRIEDSQADQPTSLSGRIDPGISATVRVREDQATTRRNNARSGRLPPKRTASSRRLKPAGGEGTVGDISPAVTTGEGARIARTRQRWMLALGGLVLVVAVVVFVTVDGSPQRQALRDYQNTSKEVSSIGQRIAELQLHSPLGSGAITPIVNVGRARVGRIGQVNGGTLRVVLGDWRPFGQTGLWLSAGSLPRAVEVAAEGDHGEGLSLKELLASRGVEVRDLAEMQVAVRQGIGGVGGDLVAEFLAAPAASSEARPGLPDLLGRLAAGVLPEAIEFAPFSGTDGILLFPIGEPVVTAYRGLLVRVVGPPDWDGRWRVARLEAASR